MPYPLYEKLKAEADKAGRSVNAELVARLEQSLSAGTDNADIVMVFEILSRLSERNPHLRYSFSVTSSDDEEGDVDAATPPAKPTVKRIPRSPPSDAPAPLTPAKAPRKPKG